MRRSPYRTAGLVIGIVAAIYVAACGYLYVFQRDYVFEPGGTLAAPAEKGLSGVEIVTIRAGDGVDLTGWYAEASPGRPTLLYFHGNAGNFSGRAKRFGPVLDSGFGLLAASYRGYPGSGGAPSEAAFFSDALEIFDWLAAKTPDIVVYGESLGTAVATHVAANRPARALVLEAPFTAALDIAAATYPWVPTHLLMRDPFLTRETILGVDEPLLVVQGTEDAVVPVEQGKRLFQIAHEPKRLAVIEGGGHSDLWDRGLWPIVLGFLRTEGVTASDDAVAIPVDQ